MKQRNGLPILCFALLVCLSLLLTPCNASAGIISQNIDPMITAGDIHATYAYMRGRDIGLLELNGSAFTLEHPKDVVTDITGGDRFNRTSGSFDLDATFNSSGELIEGDFSVKGSINNGARVTLLRGTLTEAYTAMMTDEGYLEFTADNFEGQLAHLFDSHRPFGMRITNLGQGFTFASTFVYAPMWGGAVAKMGRAVPEPSTYLMFAGILGMVCFHQHRRQKQTPVKVAC